jgi:hypothetical protein
MATRKTATKAAPEKAATKTKAAKAEAPAKPAKAAKAEAPAFGTAELVAHVNSEAGTSYTASTLRILLRKLTREGVLDRDAEGGRQRYAFKGTNDPQVKAIVKAVKAGGAEKAKAERLEDLKSKRSSSKKAAPAKAKGKTKKAAPVEVEDDDELEVDDDI